MKLKVPEKRNFDNTLFIKVLVNIDYRVSLKEIKAILPRLNCKIQMNKLRELFNEVDTRKRNEIGFDDFSTLYQKMIFNENVSFVFYL